MFLSPGLQSPRHWRPLGVALLILLVACGEVTAPGPPPQLSDDQLASLVSTVLRALGGESTAMQVDIPGISHLYIALWRGGRRVGQAWGQGPDIATAARVAAGQVYDVNHATDVVELSLAHGFRILDPNALGDDLTPIHRGVRGLQVSHGERVVRYAPSQMVARNLSFERALSETAELLEIDGQTLLQQAELATFEALQVLLDLGALTAVQLFRGNFTLVPEIVQRRAVATAGELMQGWMRSNLHSDGRMTYMYYPASGRESQGNNMIRQWMASVALTRMALRSGDPEDLAAAERNIRYNLEHFFLVEDGLGLIEYKGKVKLGAVALAALAILEHPARDNFREEFKALVATTDHLWREDGSFQTFFRPAGMNDNPNLHNFYPGETLLLWASMLDRARDSERFERFMQSFRYYRDWHLANRKPSFTPWHTQAYYMLWQQTGDEDLRDWLFEMNDWLLGMQVNSRQAYDDTLGRFYDPTPEHAHFGPPHASSTGVYLEGLVDAYRLAVEVGDESRIERYGQAMRMGLRSAMQLQFRDDASMWFVSNRQRVTGGLRTTVYNNVIRVDNVQHTLMGLMKILDYDEQALAGSAAQARPLIVPDN